MADRKVRRMNLISPTGVGVNIGDTLQPDEYIGVCRREIMDQFFRDRAIEYGAESINGLVRSIDVSIDHKTNESQYTLNYQEFNGNLPQELPKVWMLISSSELIEPTHVFPKLMDAGQYNFAIAFQKVSRFPKRRWNSTRRWQRCMLATMFSPIFPDGFSLNMTTLAFEQERL